MIKFSFLKPRRWPFILFVLFICSVQLYGQNLEVSGTVHDSSGEPIVGVNVIEQGTTNGTVTDINGAFSMAVTQTNATLDFSFIGFEKQSIPLDGQTTFKVVLQADVTNFDEVVVVGYGTQKKSHITGSISSVTSDELTKVPATNTSQLLGGKLPGLVVTSRSGQPGNDQANLSIRGFGGALVIVDGVERDFQQLDPNEIESVSILKDAAAAVYGARAGNGVILVTTKKGRKNTKAQINYTGNFSLQQPTFMPQYANAPEYVAYSLEAGENRFTEEDLTKYQAGTELGYEGMDWQDAIFRDRAPFQQHNLNVSGGTENTRYFVSLGSLNQESLLKLGAGEYDRYNISSNIDIDVTEKLTTGINLKWRQEHRDNPINREGDPNEYYRVFLYTQLAKPTIGLIPGEPDLMSAPSDLDENPLAFSRQDISGFSKDTRNQFDMNLTFDYTLPIDGLSANGTFAMKNYDRINTQMRTPFDLYTHNYTTGENSVVATRPDNSLKVKSWRYNKITANYGLNYDKQIRDHHFSGLLLHEMIFIDSYEFSIENDDAIDSEVPYLTGTIGNNTIADAAFEDGRRSIVGRFNYNYKEKYLFEALYRADWSTRYAEENRVGSFPGLSVGWRLSKERFMSSASAVNDLKLRLSYAHLGMDNTSEYDYLTGYTFQNSVADMYGFGNQVYNATLQTLGPANKNITWENMYTYNAGVSGLLWSGLLGFEADVFYRLRTDMMASRIATVPNTLGAQLPKENLEEKDDRGFELALTHKNNVGEFTYSVAGNVTWTRSKWVYKEEREFDMEDPDDARLNQKTGEWANRLFGYTTDGFWNTQEELDADYLSYPALGKPGLGDIKYIDINNDSIIDYRDQDVIGRGNTPEIMFGFNFNMAYKGFDMTMFWQGAANFNVHFSDRQLAPNLSIGQIPYQYQIDNAWRADDYENALLPAPYSGGTKTYNATTNDMMLRDATYLRLKNLSIGYNIPRSVLDKAKVRSLRVFVSGTNLITFKKLGIFDYDPEMLSGASTSTYPLQKVITAGLTIGL